MALTTSQLRQAWAPHCTGPFTRVALFGEGAVSVRPAIVPAVEALSAILRKYNYKSRKADTGAYNCRQITGGTNYSLHAYGIAIDINWQANPYGKILVTDMPRAMVAEIKALRTNNGKQIWGWGGDYSGNKDAMHYEVVCSPADLKTGVKSSTVEPTPTPPNNNTGDEELSAEALALLNELKVAVADIKKTLTETPNNGAFDYSADIQGEFNLLAVTPDGQLHQYVASVVNGTLNKEDRKIGQVGQFLASFSVSPERNKDGIKGRLDALVPLAAGGFAVVTYDPNTPAPTNFGWNIA